MAEGTNGPAIAPQAELGKHDRQLEDAEALPTNRFGRMQPSQASRGWQNPVGRRVHHLVGGSHPSAGAPSSTTSQPATAPSDSDAHTTEPGCTPASNASDTDRDTTATEPQPQQSFPGTWAGLTDLPHTCAR